MKEVFLITFTLIIFTAINICLREWISIRQRKVKFKHHPKSEDYKNILDEKLTLPKNNFIEEEEICLN